jgi:tRNA (mo5U34)-methyltransferase
VRRRCCGARRREPAGLMALDPRELRRRAGEVAWWHTIDLGHGVVTPGVDATPRRIRSIQMPARLDGRSVLDVGAWDGAYAFEAERRGADRVMAVDTAMWQMGPPTTGKDGFELAREALDSKVEDREVEVLDISPDTVGGTFDVVLFVGVLYHMPHPLMALHSVSSVTREHLIVETASDLPGVRRPAGAMYPSSELGGDSSNWWGFNTAAVVQMVRAVGFSEVEVVSRPGPLRRVARLGARAGRALRYDPRRLSVALQQGRVIVHGRR